VQGAAEPVGIGPDAGKPDRPLRGAGQDELDRHDPGNHVGGRLDPGRRYADQKLLPALGRLPRNRVDTATIDRLYAELRQRGSKCQHCYRRLRDGEPPMRPGEVFRLIYSGEERVHVTGPRLAEAAHLSPSYGRALLADFQADPTLAVVQANGQRPGAEVSGL
jgi:hypothetical protein